MSAQANIVAFDGAPTPVSHTLINLGSMRTETETVAEWAERLAAVPHDAQVSVTMRKRRLKSGIEQMSVTVNIPVMEAVAGNNAAGYTAAPSVAYTETVVITQYSNRRSQTATRRLARQMALNVAGGIATSVAAVISGPGPELFDLGVVPS